MSKRQVLYVLTDRTIRDCANEICKILQDYTKEKPCPATVLMEETGLTRGQLSTVIKYMRRCSEKDLEKYIRYYPISSKKGYFFSKKSEDFASYFLTLNAWSESVKRTIAPALIKLTRDGVNLEKYMPRDNEPVDIDSYLIDMPEMGKKSWFD